MYVSARSHPTHPFAKHYTCFQTISEHCMIAFSGLNLLVRFNHPKDVHTKIKLINELGIFLYFPHRYSSRIGNCSFANNQQNVGTKILPINYYQNSCLWVYEHIYRISVEIVLSSKSLTKIYANMAFIWDERSHIILSETA